MLSSIHFTFFVSQKFYNPIRSIASWWVSGLTYLRIFFFLQFILYIYYIIMKLNWINLFLIIVELKCLH